MLYSQKYCLVSFIKPLKSATEFNMSEWPLHVTIADVFAINRDLTKIEHKIKKYLSSQLAPVTTVNKEATLGTTDVVLLDKNQRLISLHTGLVDLLKTNDAIFNSPDFNREGFLPHCTIQKTGKLQKGDKVTINSLSLVDMFPNNNWQQRKILNTFMLQLEPIN